MLWFFPAIVVIVCVAYLTWTFLKPRRLAASKRSMILSQWQSAQSQTDPHRRLLEADSVIARLLEALGFTGSMADKLRGAGKILPGLDGVWDAHKLRNRIAHEPGLRLTEVQVNRAMDAFDRVIRKFT
ncbi:MAG: hypothetical protein HOO67_02165 [Candidatus Peribacteraceae bacterium]|nr:hypothetical protein [Candidatus Peribacteraceae bacterium]